MQGLLAERRALRRLLLGHHQFSDFLELSLQVSDVLICFLKLLLFDFYFLRLFIEALGHLPHAFFDLSNESLLLSSLLPQKHHLVVELVLELLFLLLELHLQSRRVKTFGLHLVQEEPVLVAKRG